MGGVGTTLISHAMELYDYGLAALVLSRQLKFHQAYRRLKLVQSAGLAGEVLDGTKTLSIRRIWQHCQTPGTSRSPNGRRLRPERH